MWLTVGDAAYAKRLLAIVAALERDTKMERATVHQRRGRYFEDMAVVYNGGDAQGHLLVSIFIRVLTHIIECLFIIALNS